MTKISGWILYHYCHLPPHWEVVHKPRTPFCYMCKSARKAIQAQYIRRDLSVMIPQVFYGEKLLKLDSQEWFWMKFPLQNKYMEYITTQKVTTNSEGSTPAHHLPTTLPESEKGTQLWFQISHQSPQLDKQSLPDSVKATVVGQSGTWY